MRGLVGTVGLVLALAEGAALATNITIFDGMAGNGATRPWRGQAGVNAGYEDNETEPRTYTGDLWDLEAFLLEGSRLSIVATYDLRNGVPQYNVRSGDIFFDVGGGVASDGLGGWEYVIHVDWLGGRYKVYANPDPSRLLRVTDVPYSNPFAYSPLANEPTILSGIFEYSQDTTLGFLSATPGVPHNVATFDVSFLGDREFTAHFTMSCGNDLLMGHGRADPPAPLPLPDSGSTMVLLGLAVVGLVMAQRHLSPVDAYAYLARRGQRVARR